MTKTILITGATDGIGLATAKELLALGHHVLMHGRSQEKLDAVTTALASDLGTGTIEAYRADLSNLAEVDALAAAITKNHQMLDVVINNAGILKTPEPITKDALDVRFVVNTLAPYRLTHCLLPLIKNDSRVINLSSAAQASVDLEAMAGAIQLSDMAAYSQSKLAITMWSQVLATQIAATVIAVNPGSLLGTKMVKEGFGTEGKAIGIGSGVLVKACLDDAFGHNISGQYFDNDEERFAPAHPDVLDDDKVDEVVNAIEVLVKSLTKK